jgi:hypothetical protein
MVVNGRKRSGLMKSAVKTGIIAVRIDPALKDRAEAIAKEDRRSVSSWVEGLIAREVASLAAAGPNVEQPAPPSSRKSREKAPD